MNCSRNTVWFKTADFPYIDFKFKGIQFFCSFTEFTYVTPTPNEKYIDKYNREREDRWGVVKEWTRTLIMFNAHTCLKSSLSINDGFICGYQLEYHNQDGTQIIVEVSPEEAREISTSMDTMILDTKITAQGDLVEGEEGEFELANSFLKIRGTTLVYRQDCQFHNSIYK